MVVKVGNTSRFEEIQRTRTGQFGHLLYANYVGKCTKTGVGFARGLEGPNMVEIGQFNLGDGARCWANGGAHIRALIQ